MLKFALPKMQPTNLVFLIIFLGGVQTQNVSTFIKTITPFKKCLHLRDPIICLKERALEALNETILDDRPIVFGFLEIQKNPDYFINTTEEALPEGVSERSSKMSDVLMSKLEEFFRSRTLKLNLSNAFEARKGGGGGGGGGKKGGGMAMMAVVGMGAMMANMMMGKLALMAGSAMMMSKIALVLCMVMIAKKMQEKGGGGEEKHIVYADSGHSHGGGGYGGGGWHRSLEDPHNLAYRGQWGASSSSENGSGKQRKPGKGQEKDDKSTVIGTTTKCSYSTTPPKRTEP